MIFDRTLIKLCYLYWLVHQFLCQEEEDPSSKSGMAGFGVWYSANEILDIFKEDKYVRMPGIRAVLSTYNELLTNVPYGDDPPLKERHPFIAIEGTHRDSRIIIGKELASYLHCTYLGNPPRSMVPLRKMFDKEKGMIRKAYFSLSMYVGAHHVRETWEREAVVTTGYWLDQAAFSIAQRFTMQTLPPSGSPIYQWPEDLLRPDVAFFLNIPQLKWGNRPPNLFKPKLAEVYRRIRGVKIVEINQTGTYSRIFAIIRSQLRKMSLLKMKQEEEEEQEEEDTKRRKNFENEYDIDYDDR